MDAQPIVPSENWDDDFEFSQSNSNTSSKPNDTRKLVLTAHAQGLGLEPRLSVTSSHFSEDWDADDGPGPSSLSVSAGGNSGAGGAGGVHSRLQNWAEPGPSTPTKRRGSQVQAENWDADFEDKADSPPSRRHHPHITLQQHRHHTHALRTRHSYHTPPRPKPPPEPENWDDEYDDPMDPTTATKPGDTDNDNTPMTKRTRRDAYADSSDDDAEFGFSEDKEEDKTVTARSRSALVLRGSSSNFHSHHSPPPVPSLPHAFSPSPIEPFPRSPAVSVFSIPTTSGRNSVGYYNSTSHLVLTGGSSLAMLPPSPPIHRERRRLRKKSRPPHLDNNVFELVEEQRDSTPPPLPPSTPERDRASSPLSVSMMPPSSTEATPANGGTKTLLLSRIGSVKKWGVRRKRASTGPAEMMMQEFGGSAGTVEEENTPRPPSSLTQVQTPSSQRNHDHSNANASTNANPTISTRSSWFFRPGGAPPGSPPPGHTAELKHERSLDQVHMGSAVGVGGSDGHGHGQVPTTPSKSGKLSKRKPSGAAFQASSSGEFTGEGSSSVSGGLGLGKPSLAAARRPTSMQGPNGGASRFPSAGTRHASYGSSIGRTSSRVFSTPTPTESVEDLPPLPTAVLQEGSRSFMGSVRKISLVGRKDHKKKKSSVEVVPLPPLPPTPFQDRADDGNRTRGGYEGARVQIQPQISDLLPPIELQPPSPPRTINGVRASHSAPMNISDGIESLMIPSSSAPGFISFSPRSVSGSVSGSVVANRASPKTPSSPQSASLGRTTQAPNPPASDPSVLRRNSLGDLKIPARISQAQIGLKRDLGMVREFATSVDKLKELQSTYRQLIAEVHAFLESTSPSRATSPTVLNLVRPRSRLRSHTSPPANPSTSSSGSFSDYKHLAASLYAITSRYKISWECAELLIELGGGTHSPVSPPLPSGGPSSSVSAPTMSMQAEIDRKKSRERAVTLSGEDSKAPPVPVIGASTRSTPTSGPSNASWRASTGRHDLSQRQLVLLRDMLNNGEVPPDDAPAPEDSPMMVNRNWRWGDAMSSTVTLPSEESGSRGGDTGETRKKRRGRMGMSGLRDMLRMLKRSHSEQSVPPPVPSLPVAPSSTASLSTESSIGSQSQHYYQHPHAQLATGAGARRGSKTSTGPESVRAAREVVANSPYGGPPLNHKASPRRPSLASIFRLGQKNKGATSSSTGGSSQDSRSDVRSASRGSNMSGEEDWDRIDSAIDLDSAARALGIEGNATIKGRKGRLSPFLSEHRTQVQGFGQRPVTPKRIPDVAQAIRVEVEASPRSIRPMRSTRLSNVEEVEDGERQLRSQMRTKNRASLPRTSPHRPPSRGQMMNSGKTGSVRSAPPQPLDDGYTLPDIKLSMTPENIKPLLENAREVHSRCNECLRELRTLLDAVPVPVNLNAPASLASSAN